MRISDIIAAGGGTSRLAEKLGLHRASVRGWVSVPPRHVVSVERITGIPREQLRPDLYRPAAEAAPEAAE